MKKQKEDAEKKDEPVEEPKVEPVVEEPKPQEVQPVDNSQDIHRRKSLLMDSALKKFQEILGSAGEFMRDDIEKLPLRKFEYACSFSEMPCCAQC